MTGDDPVGWATCLGELERVARRLAADAGDGRPGDMAVKTLGACMGAYLTHVWGEPDHPSFFPGAGYYQMYGTPNPDTMYRTARVDGGGRYLLTGHRGTVPDVTIMPFGPPTASGVRTFTPYDLDDLHIANDGTFAVELSAEPPPTDRDWWQLEPQTRSLMLRSVSESWGAEIEPSIAIVRLDTHPRRPRFEDETLRAKLAAFPLVVEGMVRSGLSRIDDIRAGGTNTLAPADYAAGGARPDQWYHEGWFELAEGTGLLFEASLSSDVRAFSLALTDPYFSTLDWANAQSSLNRVQASVDGDGVLRAVVACDDPGVANWLDTTGHRTGVLQCRWTGGDAAPHVQVRPVDLSDLPASMSRVTPQERETVVRERAIGFQRRAQW